MGMSEFYGPGDEQESVTTLALAVDTGCTFLDTADRYGPFTDDPLVGPAIASRREEAVLATKSSNERRPDGTRVGHQDDDVAPIPGTKDRTRLQENLGALDVALTSEDLARLDELAAPQPSITPPRPLIGFGEPAPALGTATATLDQPTRQAGCAGPATKSAATRSHSRSRDRCRDGCGDRGRRGRGGDRDFPDSGAVTRPPPG
jgi:hypothetical protein